MLLNPFYPFTFLKISSLKATIVFLSILLIKSNLLRLKGGLIGGFFALILISGIFASSTIALGSLVYAYRLKKKSNSIAYHLVRESVAMDESRTGYVNTLENLADLMTKPLPKGERREGLVSRLMWDIYSRAPDTV